ncbi:hypothetical protein OSTOST_22205, partial [Ostertagia ostertagi]
LGGAEHHTVLVAFGDIPFVVLGAKGVGRNREEADSNCAYNLISRLQGYLNRQALANIRKKWAAAESEVDEAVEVFRFMEEIVNSTQYCQLKTIPILEPDPPEKGWARQLRIDLRKMYDERRPSNASSSKSAAANGIFT